MKSTWTWLLLLASLLAVDSILAACQPGERPGKVQQDGPRSRTGQQAAELQVGQLAPDFRLKSLDGKSETTLSSFRNQKPVVLFFGSYT